MHVNPKLCCIQNCQKTRVNTVGILKILKDHSIKMTNRAKQNRQKVCKFGHGVKFF